MAHFRRLMISLEDEAVVQAGASEEPIVDQEAATDAVVDPEVSSPTPAPAEDAPADDTATPAADAPADDAAADVNTPASTGETPAPTEEAPADVAASEEAPTSTPEVPAESAQPAEGETPAEAPADTATPAPTEEVPAATDEAGATDEAATSADTAATATPAPAETGDAANAPASTDGGEGVPADTPIEEAIAPTDEELSLEDLETFEDIRNESDLLVSIADTEADDTAEQQLTAVLESIDVIRENMAGLIENDQCTEATAQMAEDSAAAALAPLGVELEFPSMESFGNDVTMRHKYVLENLDNYADRIAQSLDVNITERIKVMIDNYRTYPERIAKIRSSVEQVRSSLKRKESSLQEKEHEGSLVGVGRFFNIEGDDVLGPVSGDVKISQYILSKYPGDILKNIDELNKIITKTNYKTPEEFAKFLNEMAEVEPQSKIFKPGSNKEVVALLGNFVIARAMGNKPKTLAYGEEKFPELAEAVRFDAYAMYNGPDFISLLSTIAGNYVKYGRIIVGIAHAIYDVVAANKISMTTAEIYKLLDAADDYLDNCEQWVRNVDKIIGSYRKLETAMSKFKTFGGDIEKIGLVSRYRAWRLLNQAKAVVRVQLSYVDVPTQRESYRAILGARNCYYLAKRLAITAK